MNGIHIKQLQSMALKLANSCWVRWYAHWNYPRREPWEVAISLADISGASVELYERDLPEGWRKVQAEKKWLVTYIWQRVDEEGKPYKNV